MIWDDQGVCVGGWGSEDVLLNSWVVFWLLPGTRFGECVVALGMCLLVFVGVT